MDSLVTFFLALLVVAGLALLAYAAFHVLLVAAALAFSFVYGLLLVTVRTVAGAIAESVTIDESVDVTVESDPHSEESEEDDRDSSYGVTYLN